MAYEYSNYKVAGFIGFHLSSFLDQNHKIIGIDNLCKSYGVKYKRKIANTKEKQNFKFYKLYIKNIDKLKEKIDYIVHLAQAGVRLSQERPELFINDNILVP